MRGLANSKSSNTWSKSRCARLKRATWAAVLKRVGIRGAGARHLILGSISPFSLEDEDEPQRWMISYQAGNAETRADVLVGSKEDGQMHRRAAAVRDFYRQCTYTVVPEADHELWHRNYLQAIKTALDRLAPLG